MLSLAVAGEGVGVGGGGGEDAAVAVAVAIGGAEASKFIGRVPDAILPSNDWTRGEGKVRSVWVRAMDTVHREDEEDRGGG